MNYEEEETFFTCPYCFETISILVDRSVDGEMNYVEDCEVCCHPISITYGVSEGTLENFSANGLDG
ncbi:MAG: CPXCG motif-containing cysteine-rich protein [Proteobacteria bacterium]|nr:MAG: CPXCG motif-containing cysteine-rich protein [Pseudomonadota bacterium]